MGENKLLSLKKIIYVVIDDIKLVLTAIHEVLQDAPQPPEVIHLARVIKEMRQRIEADKQHR
jgi:hypothetical protein